MLLNTITLQPMQKSEFANYLKTSIPNYAEEKQRGENLTAEQAMKVANDSFDKLLPQGLETPDQFLFTVVDEKKTAIGTLWFAKKSDGGKPHAWIFDIVLEPAARGKGYGKQLMTLLETEVKKVGLKSIGLHVFGHNTVAASLYEKSGFSVTNKIMRKEL